MQEANVMGQLNAAYSSTVQLKVSISFFQCLLKFYKIIFYFLNILTHYSHLKNETVYSKI